MNEWQHYNLDLVQEIMENHKKAVIIIAGASSSGKSHASRELKNLLERQNLKTYHLSTDNYSKGLTRIIVENVNRKYFTRSLDNANLLISKIKKIIINSKFEQKLCDDNIAKIKKSCKNLIPNGKMELFIQKLKEEFNQINFDDAFVYDLDEVASDINALVQNKTIDEKVYSKVFSERDDKVKNKIFGSNIDVILVEGIYALNKKIVDNIKPEIVVKNFIEGDSKTLFLRRVLRDAKITSFNNANTIKYYLEKVVPEYKKSILPTKKYADLILQNYITFEELIQGQSFTVEEKHLVKDKKLLKKIFDESEIVSTQYQRDVYYISKENSTDSSKNMLRVRLVGDSPNQLHLSTLVHKGRPKYRKDAKLIRPINVLIKEGEFDGYYSSFSELDTQLKNAGMAQKVVVNKKRYRMILNNEKLVLDEVQGLGSSLEIATQLDSPIIKEIKQKGRLFTSYYQELCKGE